MNTASTPSPAWTVEVGLPSIDRLIYRLIQPFSFLPVPTLPVFVRRCTCFRAPLLLLLHQNQTGGKAPTKGVLGFCVLLLKTCEYDAAPVFQKLLDSYRGDLSVDESLFGVSQRFSPRCRSDSSPINSFRFPFLVQFSPPPHSSSRVTNLYFSLLSPPTCLPARPLHAAPSLPLLPRPPPRAFFVSGCLLAALPEIAAVRPPASLP